MAPKILTLKTMEEKSRDLDIVQLFEWVKEFRYQEYPERPKKPHLTELRSSEPVLIRTHAGIAEIYAKDLRDYATAMETYNEQVATVKKHEHAVNDVVVEFIKKESRLYNIPKDKQQKVWDRAYEKRHSDGYFSVYQELCSLIELFV